MSDLPPPPDAWRRARLAADAGVGSATKDDPTLGRDMMFALERALFLLESSVFRDIANGAGGLDVIRAMIKRAEASGLRGLATPPPRRRVSIADAD
jgi:hypothetical protein